MEENIKSMIKSSLNCTPEEFTEKYNEYKKAEKEFKDLYEPFKEHMLGLYKNMPELPNSIVVGGVRVSYVSPSVRSSIDSKKLKEEEPEIAKKYTKNTKVDATMKITNINQII